MHLPEECATILGRIFYIPRTSRYNTALKMEQLETLGCEFQLPSTQLVLRRPESVRE